MRKNEELAAALMDSHDKNSGTKRRRKSTSKKRKQQKRKPNWARLQLTVNLHTSGAGFKGSMDAHEVNSLREEITAVLAAFKPQNRLCSVWKTTVAWSCTGLAASQLQRLRDKTFP
ncbi:hypothetical protein ACNKHP_01440 [Shigella boydii]